MPKPSRGGILRTSAAVVRCAIYTRKSSEEGLEQDFNSLHAQREACEAYVRSQTHEGWSCLSARYDDGGISGASMQRPALQRLLADIRAGKVDTVVVYKVDRLTRSLADFAKIVEIFDASGVAFVSVTQQFNTTSSMGRLTLNVLLSFAQFEREVTGERIRDKIAASKQKGMWMGGSPPLGYDAHERTLLINEPEAATVRHIFQRYIALGSVGALQEELVRDGITSKRWVSRSGRTRGGVSLARGALYHLLGNRLYLGEIVHKDRHHPGQHSPIVDRDLWDQAQVVLAGNASGRRRGRPVKHGNLLTGLLFDATGRRMTPTFAVKSGQRYRYYAALAGARAERRGTERALRLPAAEVEQLVGQRLCQFLADGNSVLEALAEAGTTGGASAGVQADLIANACMLARSWPTLAPDQQRRIITALIARIEVSADGILIHLVPDAIRPLAMDDLSGRDVPDHDTTTRSQPEPGSQPSDQDASRHTVVLTVAARQLRIGQGHKLIVPGSGDANGEPIPALVKLVVRAHHLRQQVLGAAKANLKSVARQLGLNHSYVTRLLRLSWLAPDITQAILAGTQPATLTAEKLIRHTASLPITWQRQREMLGFR